MMSVENVRVGDLVRCLETECDVTKGHIYVVNEVDARDNSVCVKDDADDNWWLFDGLFEPLAAFASGDTVRLKSGEPFTDGNYTAEVDSTKGDIVLLKIGSWLPVDTVEKVEAKPQRFKVGDRFDYTCRDSWQGMTVEEIKVNSDGDATYFATDPDLGRGGFTESMMIPAAEPKPSDPEPLILTLSVDTRSLQADLADQFQRIADALRAA